MPQQWLDLDGYIGRVQFGMGRLPLVSKDWRHRKGEAMPKEQADSDAKPEFLRGRGLVIQASKHEFYLIGIGWRLFLSPKHPPDKTRPLLSFRNEVVPGRHLSVEEGHFDEKGEFVIDRQRNKDPMSQGAWVEADIGVLRVIMCD